MNRNLPPETSLYRYTIFPGVLKEVTIFLIICLLNNLLIRAFIAQRIENFDHVKALLIYHSWCLKTSERVMLKDKWLGRLQFFGRRLTFKRFSGSPKPHDQQKTPVKALPWPLQPRYAWGLRIRPCLERQMMEVSSKRSSSPLIT